MSLAHLHMTYTSASNTQNNRSLFSNVPLTSLHTTANSLSPSIASHHQTLINNSVVTAAAANFQQYQTQYHQNYLNYQNSYNMNNNIIQTSNHQRSNFAIQELLGLNNQNNQYQTSLESLNNVNNSSIFAQTQLTSSSNSSDSSKGAMSPKSNLNRNLNVSEQNAANENFSNDENKKFNSNHNILRINEVAAAYGAYFSRNNILTNFSVSQSPKLNNNNNNNNDSPQPQSRNLNAKAQNILSHSSSTPQSINSDLSEDENRIEGDSFG
jgi:hypothetical protein